MASGGHILQQQRIVVENKIRSLVNNDLKEICKAYEYQVSGTKAVLQGRCLEILNNIVSTGDVQSFDALRYRVDNRGRSPPPNNYGSPASHYPTPGYQNYNMAPQRGLSGATRMPSGGKYFKSSPFYDRQETLLNLQDLPDGPEMPQNRHTVRSTFTIRPDLAEQFRKENYRILMYCGVYHASSPFTNVDVSFPNQIEVKVNDTDVKANFKGLKNKPGSTKPADITSLVSKFRGQQNTVQVTYALTTKRHAFMVNLVKYVSAEALTERIKRHSVIRKQKVLDAMALANSDPDIAATSIRMSLKDPVSTMRIKLPVRSSHCTHNQCFDGGMFMALQEQAPQWSCPFCSKTVAFESLCVDEYFQEILNKTPQSIEKVDIEPNGEWRVIKEEDDSQANGTSSKARASYDDDFDDIVEVDQPRSRQMNGVKRESYPPMMPSPMSGQSFTINTPPLSSRAPSVAQSTTSTQRSNKRPQGAIIDLTLSDDDEDDDPPRPAKRQAPNHRQSQSNSFNRNQVHLPDPRPRQNQYQNQTDSYRPTSSHNHLQQPNYNAQSISPPNHQSSAVCSRPSWPGQNSHPPMQQHSSTNSSYSAYSNNNNNGNGGVFPPNSPFSLNPPPQQNNQSSTYSPAQGQHGGLRLPPINAGSPQNQSGYQGSWRGDYDYNSYSQSPG